MSKWTPGPISGSLIHVAHIITHKDQLNSLLLLGGQARGAAGAWNPIVIVKIFSFSFLS